MFDMIPTWSPASRVTFHVLERFLAAIGISETRAHRVEGAALASESGSCLVAPKSRYSSSKGIDVSN